MSYSNDNKAIYAFLIAFYIFIIGLFPTAAYAMDADDRFEKTLMSFEVEGVSLSTQVSALESVLTDAGYKLKKKSKQNQQLVYSFVRGKGKTSSSMKVSVMPDGAIKSIHVSLRDANIESLLNSEKPRYEKSFADYSHLCQSRTNVFKCSSFTAADRISISIKSSKKAITYDIASKESTKAKKRTEKRQAQARADELAMIEAARQEELSKVREAQRAVAQAEFAKKMADHPCFQFDVNNHKQALNCLQALEIARVKSEDRYLPTVFGSGSCQEMKRYLDLNLKSIGFWEEAINERIPNCKLLAELYKEKHGSGVYWSPCIDKPEVISVQYIYDCASYGGASSMNSNNYGSVFRKNFTDAGYTLDNTLNAAISDKLGSAYTMMVDKYRQNRKEQEDYKRDIQIKDAMRFDKYVYKTYYEETPERKKSKFSDAERKLMKNNKLVVPVNYPPPSAEEVRLAVIRSYAARQNERGNEAVVTDGHTLYIVKQTLLIKHGLRVAIHFEEVKDLTCRKQTNSTGYMCRYKLAQKPQGKTALSGGLKGGVNTALAHIEKESSHFQNNWFLLTDTGWMQPYTDEQIAGINQRNEEARKNAAAFQKETKQQQESFDNWLQ